MTAASKVDEVLVTYCSSAKTSHPSGIAESAILYNNDPVAALGSVDIVGG